MDAVSQYALAYALTTSAGIRALLPLAAVSVAAHVGWIHPSGDFAWLGHALVMWILIGVAVLEMVADKVPLVDHAMHFVQIASKPAAAAILVGGTLHAQSHEQLVFLMVIGARLTRLEFTAPSPACAPPRPRARPVSLIRS